MKTKLLAAAATLAFFSTAQAADTLPKSVVMQPGAVPAVNWTGIYVGGHVGAGWGTVAADTDALLFGLAGPLASANTNGMLGGLQLGANWQNGSLVFGLEGDVSFASIEGSSPCVLIATCSAETGWIATAAARVGLTADRALIYVKGGAAWADQDVALSAAVLGATIAAQNSDTRSGWLLGAGIEYAVTQNWSAKLEYNFIDFGRDSFTSDVLLNGTSIGTATGSVETQLHLMKAGVNYRF